MDLSTLPPWQMVLLGGLAISVILLLIILVVCSRRNLGERRQLDNMRDELEEATRALEAEIARQSLSQREEQLKTLQKIGDSLANLINRGADQQSSQFSLWQQSAYEHDRASDGRQARMYQMTEESLAKFEQRMKAVDRPAASRAIAEA
ncbi:MAG TPA: hypothetical protein PLR69_08965, partial [Candidatus Limiplasma sp.]|nr:hypothetical protein [Candidatus Limiplasma sp.]